MNQERFIDELEIEVQAGSGGGGAVSFHHEKFRSRGGPDGGDGGRGGDVIFETDPSIKNLLRLAGRGRTFKAEGGKKGGKNKKAGQDGKDLIIKVPVGTELIDPDKETRIADLISEGARLTLARGAAGGRGNARFATATDQAPRRAGKGKKAEPKKIRLRLKFLADVGLIGYPNTGKSTLLAHLTSARSRIADYPFTTLKPNLGIMQTDEFASFILVDMPALTEGAHQGNGIGNRFLQHLERVKILVHLLDISQEEALTHFDLVNEELCLYDESLDRLPQIVAINKVDFIENKERIEGIKSSLDSRGYEAIPISALKGEGLDELKNKIVELLKQKEWDTNQQRKFLHN